ncbi:hypothetical protein QBC38DRAFT_483055 [Podospora fimiseda]|uniref:Mid2 domain-containing protein n=1 Tax=Podospora fimiseda TaxID=252190 RepID=A0AAN7GZ18_9PEZI|nr:hypothetical protein QBC38DRAFT_483055 [Podospora fimiseda]
MTPTKPKYSLSSFLFLYLIIPLFPTFIRADSNEKQCFFTNGDPAPGYSPCDPSAESSSCCNGSAGYKCLFNTLCIGPNNNVPLVRGACTDKTWTPGGACKRYCFGVWDTPANMVYCANDTSNETGKNYCCEDEAAAGSKWYWFTPQDVSVVAVYDEGMGRYSAVTTKKSKSTMVVPEIMTVTNGVTVSVSVSAAEVTTTETAKAKEVEVKKEETDLPVGVWVGIGIGGLLVVILLSVGGFMLWKRRQNKQLKVAELDGSETATGCHGSSDMKWRADLNELPSGGSDTSEMDNKSIMFRRELATGKEAAEMDPNGLDRGELATGWEVSEMDGSEGRKELPAAPGEGRKEFYAQQTQTHYVELPTERYY